VAQIPIGPYLFTERDARRTLANAPAMIQMMAGDRQPNPIEHLVARVDELLDGTDPNTLDSAELPDLLARIWATLAAAPATLRAGHHVPATTQGTIAHLHRGDGGVPKSAIPEAYVDWRGVEGDVQRTREHHGRPFQALCLWSAEVIERLRSQGHPIFPGAAGENITISGIPWDLVTPGVRLRVDEVVCEVWAYAVPCRQNAQWMSDGDFSRLHHDRGPGLSRVYATVTQRGRVRVGAAAVLEP
jgi:MOSC domain-containing protein YiiM